VINEALMIQESLEFSSEGDERCSSYGWPQSVPRPCSRDRECKVDCRVELLLPTSPGGGEPQRRPADWWSRRGKTEPFH